MKCHGSAILPGEAYDTDEAERARDWGRLVHSWKETGKIRAGSGRPGALLDKAIRTSGVQPLTLWPANGQHEISFALRVDGVREVRTSDSPLTDEVDDGWITGTADYQGTIFDGQLWVDDLKTGKIYEDDEGNNRFPQDVNSPQLMFYGLGLAQAAGYRGPVHISLTHWPRLPISARHRPPIRYWTTISEDEQETFYKRLEAMYNVYLWDKLTGEPTLQPGDHCRFCPSRNYCIEAKTDFPIYRRSFYKD